MFASDFARIFGHRRSEKASRLACLLAALALAGAVHAEPPRFTQGGQAFEGIMDGLITDGAGNILLFKAGKMSPMVLDPGGTGSIFAARPDATLAPGKAIKVQDWCRADAGCAILNTDASPFTAGTALPNALSVQLSSPLADPAARLRPGGISPDGYVSPDGQTTVPGVIPTTCLDPKACQPNPARAACLAALPKYCVFYQEDPHCVCP
jgi:hypothetical protein